MLCVALEEDIGFVGPVWSSSVETSYKEEGDHVLKAVSLTLDAGAMEAARVKATCTEVFVEVLMDRRRFLEVNKSSGKIYM